MFTRCRALELNSALDHVVYKVFSLFVVRLAVV
jgi:hypothetical protein